MCVVCQRWDEESEAATISADGAVAQLVERFHGMEEVARSIRVSSTFFQVMQDVGSTLAGFVAGEGSFVVTRKSPTVAGDHRKRFVFAVHVATRDRPILEALQQFLGCGSINDRPCRRDGWQPTSAFSISSLRGHHAATIPFCERFLLPCAKRVQFERWRGELDAWERERPSRWGQGRSICSAAGCDGLVRGGGLCRHHYYRATGY